MLLAIQDGRTALLLASQNGYAAVVEVLLAVTDIDVNMKDKVRICRLILLLVVMIFFVIIMIVLVCDLCFRMV